jgi:hypothetical protein
MNVVASVPNIRILKDRAALTLLAALSITLALLLLALGVSERLMLTINEAQLMCASLRQMTRKRPAVVASTCSEVHPEPAANAEPLTADLETTG